MADSFWRERVGVTGHQDLPPAAVQLLLNKLNLWYPDSSNVLVICSLAVGADTIVAQQLTKRGAGLHVVVPSNDYSSTFEPNARRVYSGLLEKADQVEVLGFEEPTEEAFMAAGDLVARSCDWLIAVWDGEGARGLGGTGDVVALARTLGKPVRIIWPEGLRR